MTIRMERGLQRLGRKGGAGRARAGLRTRPGKKVVPPTSPPDPERVRAMGRKISVTCSYCHDRCRRDEVVFCATCLAPHHAVCFREHGSCSAPGCGEERTVRPESVKRARRKRKKQNARGRAQADSAAMTCLVLGILSVTVCVLLAPFAIMKGNEAKRLAVAARCSVPSNAQIGIILGWIGAGLFALAFLWVAFLLSTMVVFA